MKSRDQIFIRGQVVSCHIGVPDEERSVPQDLMVHTRFSPSVSCSTGSDEIDQTVDYHSVYMRINELATSCHRKLIETLAEDLAAMVLTEFAVDEVSIEIEKFILPNTDCVGVAITRTKTP